MLYIFIIYPISNTCTKTHDLFRIDLKLSTLLFVIRISSYSLLAAWKDGEIPHGLGSKTLTPRDKKGTTANKLSILRARANLGGCSDIPPKGRLAL